MSELAWIALALILSSLAAFIAWLLLSRAPDDGSGDDDGDPTIPMRGR